MYKKYFSLAMLVLSVQTQIFCMDGGGMYGPGRILLAFTRYKKERQFYLDQGDDLSKNKKLFDMRLELAINFPDKVTIKGYEVEVEYTSTEGEVFILSSNEGAEESSNN